MKLTKKDFDENNKYIKSDDLISNEEIEIEGNLGYVFFSGKLSSKKYIIAGAGSGVNKVGGPSLRQT